MLRVPVNCFSCKSEVDKSSTILLKSINQDLRYQCSSCYKRYNASMRFSVKAKKELYCGRCRYRFSSKGINCPYCNKDDLVMESNISVSDLL